jgi:hypothetical protein
MRSSMQGFTKIKKWGQQAMCCGFHKHVGSYGGHSDGGFNHRISERRIRQWHKKEIQDQLKG